MVNQEEKNESTTSDENLKSGSIQDKNENGPFDGEDRLDIDTGSDSSNETAVSSEKSGFNMKTLIVVALLLLPVVYIIYKTMGNSSTQEQAVEQAQQIDVVAYENAASANPNFTNLLNLSNAYINSGMASKAIEPLKKAIELNPNSSVAYSNLGFAYTIIQQYKEGVFYGEKAVQLDTSFQLAKNNLNWAKSEQKNLIAGIEEMEKTPEDKRDIGFYTNYGLQFLKLQEYEKSIAVWNKMLTIEPSNAVALINKGVAYMSLLEYDKAIDVFQKAVDNAPNDQLAKNNLAWALNEKKKANEVAEKNASERVASGKDGKK